MHSLRGKRNEPEANVRQAVGIQLGLQVQHFTLKDNNKDNKNIMTMQE
jgi:hypothetical protein|tara:strand:+ start:971 stop:1114 length:144 start_codon:yes stop_codon:yes gene_type:complete